MSDKDIFSIIDYGSSNLRLVIFENYPPFNKFLILNIGRLHHKKGLDLLPEILSNIKSQDWLMIFVGGDNDGTKTFLINEFKKRKILEKIFFLNMKKFGYSILFENYSEKKKLIKVFQMRFRPERVSGILDLETFNISKTLK